MRLNSRFILIALFAVLCVLAYTVNCQNKQNMEVCNANEECSSRSCVKGRCKPLKCRNDKTCIKAGLRDHYCRRRGLRIVATECVPKRGIFLAFFFKQK